MLRLSDFFPEQRNVHFRPEEKDTYWQKDVNILFPFHFNKLAISHV